MWTFILTGHLSSAGSLFELYPLRALNKYSQRFSVFQKINDLQTGDLDKDKSNWKWTLMIMQPDFVTKEMIDSAISNVRKKKNPAAISKVRFTALTEGKCAQILHIGPFSEEGPTVEKVHQFIDSGGKRVGKHHEIYLSDIRKADPAKWKTVIRQPMQ